MKTIKASPILRVFVFFILLGSIIPASGIVKASVQSVPPPVDMFQWPWDQGASWVSFDGFDNGKLRLPTSPHYFKLGGAIDFAPHANMVVGEDTSNDWVVAAAAGTVVTETSCYIIIDHGNGWTTEYWHLANLQVQLAQQVYRNQRLGVIADNITQQVCPGNEHPGPHLHFVMRPSMKDTVFAGWTINYNVITNLTTFTKFGQTVGRNLPLLNVPNLQIVDRGPIVWDTIYKGSVDPYRYERWSLQLTGQTKFNLTVSSLVSGLVPQVALLNSSGAEITHANGTLGTTQPAGSYFVRIKSDAGSGFYNLIAQLDSTPTPTNTPTSTGTIAPTNTPTITLTPTATSTNTPTFTQTPTPTRTSTPTSTGTSTPINTSTFTPTPTSTATNTPTNTFTFTPTPTSTGTTAPTFTPTPTSTGTVAATSTPSSTPTSTSTGTSIPTNTPTSTNTFTPTSTSVATNTFTPTSTPTASQTPVFTNTPTSTFTPTSTSTAAFTNTPTSTPTPTGTPVITQPYVLTSANPINLNVGSIGLITVSLNNIPVQGYTSTEFTCTYNPSLVEVSNIVIGVLFGADPVSAINGPQNGTFILGIAGSNGNRAFGNGPAFTFNVKGLLAGQTVVECKARSSQGDNILTTILSVPSTITLSGSTPTPTAMPTTATLTGRVLASKLVTIRLYRPDNSIAATITANPDGTFSITAPGGTYTAIATAPGFLNAQGPVTLVNGTTTSKPIVSLLAGDIDNNGVINQLDALTIGINYNGTTPAAADLNNDGIINVLDLGLLAQNYLKSGALAW